MGDTQGTFIWYELATTDLEGAIAFYGDVAGWRAEQFGGGAPPYWIWSAGGAGLGGVMALTSEAARANPSPHWIGYVKVDDVDAATAKALALGATSCVPPHDIPTVGRISMFADPEGALLALIAPEGPDRPTPAGPGHVVWRELLADDTETELRFYAELFGWKETRSFDMGGDGAYRIWGKGGREQGGMFERPADYPLAPHWLFYVHVDDLDAAVARVRRAGGKIWNGPMAIPSGQRIAQCQDPAGAVFALHGT